MVCDNVISSIAKEVEETIQLNMSQAPTNASTIGVLNANADESYSQKNSNDSDAVPNPDLLSAVELHNNDSKEELFVSVSIVQEDTISSASSIVEPTSNMKRSQPLDPSSFNSPEPSPVLCNIMNAYPKLVSTPPNAKRSIESEIVDSNPNPLKHRKVDS
jgi:hypothetical protein